MMETTQIGPTRHQWKTKNPKVIARLDYLLAKTLADVQPFLGEEHTLLGVDKDASKREVKNAYRRQARKLHPDKGGDEAAMKVLNAAYKKVLAAAKA